MDWQNLIKEAKAQDEELGAASANQTSNGHARFHQRGESDPGLSNAQGSSNIAGRGQFKGHPDSPEIGQHASRMFGHQLDQRIMHLPNSINAGPLPAMPTHESEAHKTLRQMAPKLQALMDLFATAYETHDMAKVEELRKRSSWAIDSRGN